MAQFMVERYLPDASPDDVRRLVEHVDAVWGAGSGEVRYLRAIVFPDDEALVFEFEAPDAQTLQEGYVRLGLEFDRIVEVDVTQPLVPSHDHDERRQR